MKNGLLKDLQCRALTSVELGSKQPSSDNMCPVLLIAIMAYE